MPGALSPRTARQGTAGLGGREQLLDLLQGEEHGHVPAAQAVEVGHKALVERPDALLPCGLDKAIQHPGEASDLVACSQQARGGGGHERMRSVMSKRISGLARPPRPPYIGTGICILRSNHK